MGRGRSWRAIVVTVVVAMLSVACSDSSASETPVTADSPTSAPIAGALPLVRGGNIIHAGNYCHFLQLATPGERTLPVDSGCQFYITTPADLFATDGDNYSVSEVVGDAVLGIRGPADAKVMVVCRLSPRAQFWFWISSDGHWNVDQVDDVHHPLDLVSPQDEESMRQYVKTASNHVQFKCAGGRYSHEISLAMNLNGHQLTALTVPMPAANIPLAKPSTPWYVDIGARLTTDGTLEGSVAEVMLYDQE